RGQGPQTQGGRRGQGDREGLREGHDHVHGGPGLRGRQRDHPVNSGPPVGGVRADWATVAVMPVAVVTDSTACLPPGTEDAYPLTVIPMRVTINGFSGAEGTEVTTADIARAFGERRVEVATSRPAPGSVAALYQELLDGGASAVVSIHLSAALSGTVESAQLAAREFGDKVTVIDSANAGMGLGFSVLAAAAAARRGRG